MKKRGIALGIFILLLALTYAQVPTPHGIAGWIFKTNSNVQVPLSTNFKVNDSTSGDIIIDQTSVPVPGYTGRYSVSIDGNNGDNIIIHAWNTTHYGETLTTLQGDMDNINVTLNTSRPPEGNVTIHYPENNHQFNLSVDFILNATIIFAGGDGTNCNATLTINNETVINNTDDEILTLGSVSDGDSFNLIWNLTSIEIGTTDLTVTALCAETAIHLESNQQQTINIDVIDNIPPNINLTSPENNTITPNNTIIFTYFVNDTGVGTKNCSLLINDAVEVTNFSITDNQDQLFNHTLAFGSYLWQIQCYDFQNNQRTSEFRVLNITDPDLYINLSSIVFPKSQFQENENITMNITVHNIGTEGVTNAVVQVWDVHDGTETQIGNNMTVTLPPETSTLLQANYTTKVGYHEITVRLDPPLATNGTIWEANETNNAANRTINIPIWQISYGDVVQDIVLSTYANQSLLAWINASFFSGNVYVVDSDSSISWSQLQALSRNASDLLDFNDFAEADTSLNYTKYSDSINNTYTSAGSIIQTDTFTVFDQTIDQVPIANSTNSTNFITGILWDTSDNTFYNGSQDIVFVTKIQNSPQQGLYGIYNYEIKVPANLKRYIQPSTTTNTDFYIELI